MNPGLEHTLLAAALVASFLAGSIPFGLLVARLFQVRDLRSQGSGNIGATNVSRVLGFWPAGFVTFALDVLKGVVPIVLASPQGAQLWAGAFGLPQAPHFSEAAIWAIGLMAVLGHCFCPWLRFNGGKGVATGFGVLMALSPLAALAGILAFALTFLNTRTGALSSLAGLAVASAAHLVLHPMAMHLWLLAAIVGVIVFRHEPNLDRMLQGDEKRF